MLYVSVNFRMELLVIKFYPLVFAVKGVAHVVASVCLAPNVLDHREQAVFSLLGSVTCPFEDSQLKLRRDVPVLNSQHVVEVNVLFFLDKAVGVHKSLEIHHEHVGQFFEQIAMFGLDSPSVDLVPLNTVLLEKMINALFDVALVRGDVELKHKGGIEAQRVLLSTLDVEFSPDDASEDVSNDTILYIPLISDHEL